MSELTFETAQKELEQIVERLERGEAELDEAIALWERGEELLRFCLTRLETAEGRIEELAQRAASTAPLSHAWSRLGIASWPAPRTRSPVPLFQVSSRATSTDRRLFKQRNLRPATRSRARLGGAGSS